MLLDSLNFAVDNPLQDALFIFTSIHVSSNQAGSQRIDMIFVLMFIFR